MSDTQIGQSEWPHLLADLRVKRDALDQIITTLETHFIRRAPFIEPAAPRPARKAKRTVARRAPKRIKSIDQRTDGRTDGARTAPTSSAEPP